MRPPLVLVHLSLPPAPVHFHSPGPLGLRRCSRPGRARGGLRRVRSLFGSREHGGGREGGRDDEEGVWGRVQSGRGRRGAHEDASRESASTPSPLLSRFSSPRSDKLISTQSAHGPFQDSFLALVKSLSLLAPSSKNVTSIASALDVIRASPYPLILKCDAALDDTGRSDLTTYPLEGDDKALTKTTRRLEGLRTPISKDCPYVRETFG